MVSICLIGLRFVKKIGNSLVNIPYFFEAFAYFTCILVYMFFEKFLIRTSNRDHFIVANSLAIGFNLLTFGTHIGLMLARGWFVFWEADGGAVYFKQTGSKAINNGISESPNVKQIQLMYQKLAQREKFLFLLGPLRNLFGKSNKIEGGGGEKVS